MNKLSQYLAIATLLGTQACAASSAETNQNTDTTQCPEKTEFCFIDHNVETVDANLLPDLCKIYKNAVFNCIWTGDSEHECIQDTTSTIMCSDNLLSTELNAKKNQGYQGQCGIKAKTNCIWDGDTM